MPKLRIVAACEKVIFDQDGPVSLISLFQRMLIQKGDVPFPDKAVSPTMWAIFSLWEVEQHEVGLSFTQVTRVIAPDGTTFAEHEGVFRNDNLEDHQIKVKAQIPGLPIWQEGMVEVRVWLKEDVSISGSYGFKIRYIEADETSDPV